MLTENEAKDIAIDHVNGGELIDIRKDIEHGRWTYEVLVQNDSGLYEVEIDAEDGSLLEMERKNHRAASATPSISEEQAVGIAMDRVGSGEIVRVKREFDDGRWEYEVIVKTDKTTYEVEIDGDSGRVKEVERKGGKMCPGAVAAVMISGGVLLILTLLTFV